MCPNRLTICSRNEANKRYFRKRMLREGRNSYSDGWVTQDFLDTSNDEGREYDPWGTGEVGEVSNNEISPISSSREETESFEYGEGDVKAAEWSAEHEEEAHYGSELDDTDDSSVVDVSWASDWASLSDWDDELSDDFLQNAGVNALYEEEDDYGPDLLYDYRSDLAVHLYEAVDVGLNLTPLLGIDELISRLENISTDESEQVRDLLSGLSLARLRRLLPWLTHREWTGNTLVLFLRFWEIWDQCTEYWVRLQWSPGVKFWFTWANRNSMTLECAYAIVLRRRDFDPEMVIDPEWLDDWESIDVWVRVKSGFYSFASFAEYRSGFKYGEDWRTTSDVSLDSEFRSPDFPHLFEHRNTRPYKEWFRISYLEHGWHDPSDWHDGLGW